MCTLLLPIRPGLYSTCDISKVHVQVWAPFVQVTIVPVQHMSKNIRHAAAAWRWKDGQAWLGLCKTPLSSWAASQITFQKPMTLHLEVTTNQTYPDDTDFFS